MTNAEPSKAALELKQVIENATDPIRIRAQLMALPEQEFAELLDSGATPNGFDTPYESLNRRVAEIIKGELGKASEARKSARLAMIETERKAKEKEELAAASARLQAEAERIRKGFAEVAKAREIESEKQKKILEAKEAARKLEEEIDVNGLVLMRKTVEARGGDLGGEITGSVINRRKSKLSYAQITFNLYDDSGAQVGSALANINGLEPGGTWKFKASTFGVDFSRYKFSELSGF